MSESALDLFKAAKDKLLEEYKAKMADVAAMRKELVKLGVLQDEASETPDKPARKGKGGKRGPRKSWPKVELDAIATIVKDKGKDGCPAGELSARFGPSFAKWKKENEKDIAKNFAITKDGTSRIWTLKSK